MHFRGVCYLCYAGDIIITILRCFKIDFSLVVTQNKYKCIRIVNKQIFNVLFDNDFVNKDKKSDNKINMSRLYLNLVSLCQFC